MADNIEDFLRRAAERRKAAAGGQGQQRPAQPAPSVTPPTIAEPIQPIAPEMQRPLSSEQPQRQQNRPKQQQKSQRQNSPRQNQQRPDAPRPQPQQANRQLQSTYSDNDMANQSVEQTAARMEEHIHQAFDHQVGALNAGAQSTLGNETGEVDIQTILKLLQQPTGLMTALVLREVLDRPVHRW